MKKITSIAFLLFSACISFTQIDLNDFQGLKAEGEIPDDFSVKSRTKYEKEKKENKSKSKGEKLDNDFLINSNYSIDRLLHSGYVVFNDPVTKYVEKVVDELLKKDRKLRKELRIYTLKSNETNAFSTRQGILFVTTGLIAQLENEAQLAFILAHEIAHYTENHVVDTYHENEEIKSGKGEYKYSSRDDRIKAMSMYSKDLEFEADELGVDLYLKSKYSIDELYSVFYILQYSYLPFDDIPFDQTFFNDSSMFLPDVLFPEEINEINGEDDYDDSKSSHPNLLKRKQQLKAHLVNHKNFRKGGKKYIVSQEEFENIKTICRFESITMDIVNGTPANALYNIFLLKKEYPNSWFLDKSIALAWYKLLKFRNAGQVSDVTANPKKVEGESHAIHYMFKKLSRVKMNTVGIKVIYNIDKKYGFDSTFVHDLYMDVLTEFQVRKLNKLGKYSKVGYLDALNKFNDSKKRFEPVVKDSINQDSTSNNEEDEYYNPNDENVSKYDRINSKKKKRIENVEAVDEDDEFDVNDFYLHAWADMMANPRFESFWEEAKDHAEKLKEEDQKESELTYRDRKKIRKQNEKKGYALGIDKVLILNPEYQEWHHRKGFDDLKSEIGKTKLTEIYKENCEALGMNYTLMDEKAYSESTAESVNDMNELMQYIYELAQFEEKSNFYTARYDQIKRISEAKGINYVVMPVIILEETKRYRGIDFVWLIYPFYWPYFITKGLIPSNDVLITNIVFNVQENRIEHVFSKFFKRKMKNNTMVKAHIYDILWQIAHNRKGGQK